MLKDILHHQIHLDIYLKQRHKNSKKTSNIKLKTEYRNTKKKIKGKKFLKYIVC